VPDRVHERQDARRNRQQVLAQLAAIHFRFTRPAAQRVVMGEQPLDLGFKRVCILQVVNPDGPAAYLVFVGRADAAAGGADLALAGSRFAHPSSSRCSGRISTAFSAMRRLSGVISTSWDCSLSISSASAHGSITTPLPITDCLPGLHDARRQQGQLVGHTVDDQRVARIVATLKRATTSARSDSQSTILPLPSSPHWAPTTTTFAMTNILSGPVPEKANGPLRMSCRKGRCKSLAGCRVFEKQKPHAALPQSTGFAG
jgi:hypothetical protein